MRWQGTMASVRPMLAVLAEPSEVPLTSGRLVYEPKYDGIRALVALEPHSILSPESPEPSHLLQSGLAGPHPHSPSRASRGRPLALPRRVAPRPPVPNPGSMAPSVTIRSRNGRDKTSQFPDLVEAFQALAAKLSGPLLVDGEIVALDERGRPASFTRLQKRIHLTGAKAVAGLARVQPVVFKAFDLLRAGDDDLRRLPFTDRRIRLQREFRPPARSPLGLSEIAVGDGRALMRRAEKEGWEGLVVKDATSIYESDRRSPTWRKLKLLKRQAFIVGGWTDPRQSRAHFGALLLGVRDEGALRFVGSVGSGFDEAALDRIAALLEPLALKRSPFSESFKTLERSHWVQPTLVVEVKYTEFTPDGRLRHPVFLGLRTDKDAGEVRDMGREADGTRYSVLGTRERTDTKPTTHNPKPAARRATARNPKPAAPQPAARRATRSPKPASAQLATKPETRSPELATLVAKLREMEDARRDGFVDLPNGDRLRVTNLWKVFWPELKVTKGDLLRYYVEVSPLLLPAVADRPLVMKRFPNGIHGITFYQQRVLEKPPQGVRTEALPAGLDPIKEDEEATNPARFIGGSLTTLLYMAQVAAISQDPWFSTVSTPLEPDQVAIDLDPGKGATFTTVLDVARWVRDELERLHIPSVPKTSGSRGLHIYIPLAPATTYETGLLLCQVVATLVASKHRRQATVERMVARRPRGTVYVDYLQNILGKTLATAYSVRASVYAGVSTPLTWDEVEEGVNPETFTIRTAPARFREVGDLWARLRTGKRVDIEEVLRKGSTA